MAEQLTDAALRALVAQWVRAALGELVEDDSLEYKGEENSIASLQSSCSRREEKMWTGLHPCQNRRFEHVDLRLPQHSPLTDEPTPHAQEEHRARMELFL